MILNDGQCNVTVWLLGCISSQRPSQPLNPLFLFSDLYTRFSVKREARVTRAKERSPVSDGIFEGTSW